MVNTSAIWQHAAPTINHYLKAAKQEPYKKVDFLKKIIHNFSRKKFREGPVGRRKTERAMGVRRTKEEIVKWNEMTAMNNQSA